MDYTTKLKYLTRKNLGCDLLIYTTGFPRLLGEMFTDMLTKTRAADNQMFVITISQARVDDYVGKNMIYGHSLIVDGYGKVLKRLNDKEDMLFLDIGKFLDSFDFFFVCLKENCNLFFVRSDFTDLEKYRRDIKLLDHKRTDVYDLVYKK